MEFDFLLGLRLVLVDGGLRNRHLGGLGDGLEGGDQGGVLLGVGLGLDGLDVAELPASVIDLETQIAVEAVRLNEVVDVLQIVLRDVLEVLLVPI